MSKYTKGDYNQYHCEIWYDDEYIGDVRPKDADTFLKLLNELTDGIPSDLLEKIKELLIRKYGFKELKISAVYHENGIDPYEYIDAEKEGKQILGVNWW